MKINGQEVDMQKVLRLYEKEHRLLSKETKTKISEWWDTVDGQRQREINSQAIKERHIHRQKIKFILINIDDENDRTELYGTQAVAKFLGYKNWNNTMNVSSRLNRTQTKEYQIIRLEDE